MFHFPLISDRKFRVWHLLSLAVVVAVLGISSNTLEGKAQIIPGTLYIRDDATGGDCTSIGIWDTVIKTCTLTQDLTNSIMIVDEDVTLDGHGHSITKGTASQYACVQGVGSVKNIKVTQCRLGMSGPRTVMDSSFTENDFALLAQGGLNFTFVKNVISNNGTGIVLRHVAGALIANNRILNNKGCGILFQNSANGVTITDNVMSRNDCGVSMSGRGNIVKNNTISHNQTIGISVFGDTLFSKIYNNNFIDNPGQQAEGVEGVEGVVFNLDMPIGGNYWSNFHTRPQECKDLNHDEICDSTYVFSGGQDNLPWIHRNAWLHEH